MNITITMSASEIEMAMKTIREFDDSFGSEPEFDEIEFKNRLMQCTIKKVSNKSWIACISMDDIISITGMTIISGFISNISGAFKSIYSLINGNNNMMSIMAGETTVKVNGKVIDMSTRVRLSKCDKYGNKVKISRKTTQSKKHDEAIKMDEVAKAALEKITSKDE